MLCPVCAHIPAGQYFFSIGFARNFIKAATLSTGVIGPKWAGFTNFLYGTERLQVQQGRSRWLAVLQSTLLHLPLLLFP